MERSSIETIRHDLARPTVHARNLFHSSAIMFEALAVYDENLESYFLGNTIGGFETPFYGVSPASEQEATALVEEAINYGLYRLVSHRFSNSPGADFTQELAQNVFIDNGGDPDYTSLDYISDGGAALGNYIAQKIIEFGLQDGSNELEGHSNTHYTPSNPDLLIELQEGNPELVNSQLLAAHQPK